MGLPIRPKKRANTSRVNCQSEENPPKKRWIKAYEAESNQSNQSAPEPGNSAACTSATSTNTDAGAVRTPLLFDFLSDAVRPPIYAQGTIGMIQTINSATAYITAVPDFVPLHGHGQNHVTSTSADTQVTSSGLPLPYMSANPSLAYGSFSTQNAVPMQSASFPAIASTSSICDNDGPLDLSMPRTGAENVRKPILMAQLAQPLMVMVPEAGEAKATTEQSRAESPAAGTPSPAQPKTPRGSPSLAGLRAPCEVCREPATGNHYRVVTCEGCKGFWKRSIQYVKKHGLAEPKYRCKKGTKDCSVLGKENRKTCQYCRFQACLHAKMDTNNVMNGEQRNIHNEKKRQNRQNRRNKERQSSVSEEQQILTNKVKEIYNDVTNRKLEVVQNAVPMQSASVPAMASTSSICDNDGPLDLSMPQTGAENVCKPILMALLAQPPMVMVPEAGEAKAATEQSRAESPAAGTPSPAQPKTPRGSPSLAGLRAPCEVCREPATGNHYRVVTCEGCKGFWKRSIQYVKKHGLAEPKYKCKKGTKDCSVIGKENRKTCQYCRFQACLRAKMDTNNVMNSEQRNIHNEKKRLNRQIRLNKKRQSTVSEDQQILTNKVKEIYNDVTNRKLEVVQNMALDNESPLSEDVVFCLAFGRELMRKLLPKRLHPMVTRQLIEHKLREHGDRLVMAFILGSYKRVDNQGSEYTLQFSSRRYTEAEVDTLPEMKRKVCKPFFTAISHFTRCFKGFGETDEHILVLAMAVTFLMEGSASCDGRIGEHDWPILSQFDDLAALILTTVNKLTNYHKAKPVAAAPIFCSYNCQDTIPSCVQIWKEDADNKDSYEAYKRCSEAVLCDPLFA